MSDERLDELSQQVPAETSGGPPLHLWQPPLSGDIDIVIHRDGRWSHEGDPIRRAALVRLFASILRREADGEYYLVTPVEKWRIKVEALPLHVVDFDLANPGSSEQQVWITTNTGQRACIGHDHALFFADAGEPGIPAVELSHGLAAQFGRAAWYRLVDASEERDGVTGIQSGGLFFPLEP